MSISPSNIPALSSTGMKLVLLLLMTLTSCPSDMSAFTDTKSFSITLSRLMSVSAALSV